MKFGLRKREGVCEVTATGFSKIQERGLNKKRREGGECLLEDCAFK